MSGLRFNIYCIRRVVFVIILLSLSPPCVLGVDEDDYSESGNPAVLPLVTELIYRRLTNLTAIFNGDVANRLGFCIKNLDADWNGAFNFTGNLEFLTACIRKTRGDLMQRLCTAAEIKFYFNSFFERGHTNYLRPNKNCNLTFWASGCEPGWACSVGANQKVDLKNSKVVPARTRDCRPCCEGFFCPQGITCMIRKYSTLVIAGKL